MSEFRIVMQVEREVDVRGKTTIFYNPEDIAVLWETDDGDAAIRTMQAMAATVREEFDNEGS